MKQSEPSEIAARLAALYQLRFGGKRAGRFRISLKYLHQLSGRKRLSERVLRDVADEIYEYGLVLISLESYFVVLDQRLFTGYRRVTGGTIDRLADIDFEDFDRTSARLATDSNDDGDK